MTLHQIVEGNPKAYGSTDLWSFDLLEVGCPLPCNDIRTFLHDLCPKGTHEASIAPTPRRGEHIAKGLGLRFISAELGAQEID
jgi:hypothetical protein